MGEKGGDTLKAATQAKEAGGAPETGPWDTGAASVFPASKTLPLLSHVPMFAQSSEKPPMPHKLV